ARQRDGSVLFWSLRNPDFPEKCIATPSGVTAIDFSQAHPNLLAVGMYTGAIAIYDTAKEKELGNVVLANADRAGAGAGGVAAPLVESSTSAGKHTEAVWQVKWVNKGAERGEGLVSISTDGRVIEWSIKKGLTFTPLMLLKRTGASGASAAAAIHAACCITGTGNTDGVISRQASGLSFDFPVGDSTVYLTATEDGAIHKCSTSYSEQYLETYRGQAGPVYRVRTSPFWAAAFLSCGADWTARLWELRRTAPVHTFSSDLSDGVNDVAWSPTNATVFASVAGDGRLELWDLERSTLDPVVRVFP
ncbi:unnamed protein product, partial [Phaeothamnion confervicola]